MAGDQPAARELFEHELAAINDSEQKFAEALTKIVPELRSPKVSDLLGKYLATTQGQVKRLDEIFKLIKVPSRRDTSEGIDGLVAEFTNYVGAETPSPAVYDACACNLASRVSSHHGTAYKQLNGLANASNTNSCAILLYDSQTEERDMHQNLDRLFVEVYQALSF
jgi:ferritin-like metal-binding protein YciE